MPVSNSTFTWVMWCGRTVTAISLPNGKVLGLGWTGLSTYLPGAIRRLNRPSLPEWTVATTFPEGSTTWISAWYGLGGHGLDGSRLGHCGPTTTRPRIPESGPAPAPARPQAVSAAMNRHSNSKAGGARLMLPWTWAGPTAVPGSGRGVGLGLQQRHVGKVPVPLAVVQAVPHDELGRDLEPLVPDVEGHPLGRGLLHQGAHLERGRATGPKVLEQVVEGEPGVHDVLHQQDVAPLDLMVEVLEDPDHARGLGGRAVRRHRHEVELERQPDVSRQVRHHHECPLQHPDQQEVASRVVGRDGLAELPDLGLNLLRGDEDALDVRLEIRHVSEQCRNGQLSARVGDHGCHRAFHW